MESCRHGHQAGDGKDYHQVSDMQFRSGCRLIDKFLQPLPGEVILDVGCGTGRITLELASRVGVSGRVVGVDISESRIDVAKAELAKRESDAPSIIYMKGSVKEAMPLGPFDAIFSSYVFHWFERADRRAIIRDIYESLKPGGRLVVCLLPPQTQPKSIAADAFALYMPEGDFDSDLGMKLDPPAVWSQLFTEAGFTVDMCEEYDEERKAPSLEAMLKLVEISMPNFRSKLIQDSHMEILKKEYRSRQGEEIVFIARELKILVKKPQV